MIKNGPSLRGWALFYINIDVSDVYVDEIHPRLTSRVGMIGGLSANNEIVGPSIIANSLSARDAIYGDAATMTNTGKVLQVICVMDDTDVTSSGTEHATGISASITPASTSSKILIRICATVSASNVDSSPGIWIKRTAPSTADIARSSADSNRQRVGTSGHPRDSSFSSLVTEGLDSPSTTSQCTYELYVSARSGYTTYVNRTANHSDAQYDNTGSTTITLMEIAG